MVIFLFVLRLIVVAAYGCVLTFATECVVQCVWKIIKKMHTQSVEYLKLLNAALCMGQFLQY